MKTYYYIFAAIYIIVVSINSSSVFAASFTGLGFLPNGRLESHAIDVSADGLVIVGMSQSSNEFGPTNEAFRWTDAEKMTGMGFIEYGATFSSAYGVTHDGNLIVGIGEIVDSNGVITTQGNEAFRWTQSEDMVGIGDLGGVNSNGLKDGIAYSTNKDGSVIVGRSESPSGPEAFRWTASTGMVGLGDLAGGEFRSEAIDVSADGNIIVGQSITGSGREAFRWTASDNMTGLGTLDGDTESVAFSISADGSTIVGFSGSGNLSSRKAFRWTISENMVLLSGIPVDFIWSEARDVSADASVIVGRANYNSDNFPFIWDESNGMRNLQELLVNEYGIDLGGWDLDTATAVSADGLTVVGDGFNPDGRSEAWLVKLDPAVIDVEIDIKPGSEPNSINLSSAGVVPVAILSSESFNATIIDPTTVSLAGASVKMVGKSDKYLCHQEDVNLDGLDDLTCLVNTAQFMIEEGETNAVLEAKTNDGIRVRGEDYIQIVPDN